MLFEEPPQKALLAVDSRRWFLLRRIIVTRFYSFDRVMVVILVIGIVVGKESHRHGGCDKIDRKVVCGKIGMCGENEFKLLREIRVRD